VPGHQQQQGHALAPVERAYDAHKQALL
jgi:hypothetical protein